MAQVQQRKLVHKQFNSPIALYSDENVQDKLNKELKLLSNGAVGIDFDDPSSRRAQTLAKSAVLAALEEEERAQSTQKPGLKRVAWPPPPETSTFIDTEPVAAPPQQYQHQQAQLRCQQQHQQHVQQLPQPPTLAPTFPSPPAQIPQPLAQPLQNPVEKIESQPSPQQQLFKLQQPANQQQHHPISIHGSPLSSPLQAPFQPLFPLPALQTFSSAPPQNIQHHAPNSNSHVAAGGWHGNRRGWSHVESPRSPGGSSVIQAAPQFAPSPAYGIDTVDVIAAAARSLGQLPQAPVDSQCQPLMATPSSHQQPLVAVVAQQQQLPFQGAPLRKEAPISQQPAPVYQSQPVASSFQGGAHRPGDSRWPPAAAAAEQQDTKQSDLDNEARRRIALGPAFRPKRVNRDYGQFFAQNALTNTYPGYRAPPGTQLVQHQTDY